MGLVHFQTLQTKMQGSFQPVKTETFWVQTSLIIICITCGEAGKDLHVMLFIFILQMHIIHASHFSECLCKTHYKNSRINSHQTDLLSVKGHCPKPNENATWEKKITQPSSNFPVGKTVSKQMGLAVFSPWRLRKQSPFGQVS